MLSLQFFIFLLRCVLTWLNMITVYLLAFVSILIMKRILRHLDGAALSQTCHYFGVRT